MIFLIIGGILLSCMIILLLALFIGKIIDFFNDYDYYKRVKSCLILSFEKFIALYNIAPNKWNIKDNRTVIYYKEELRQGFHLGAESFTFETYKDYCKYNKWRENKEKYNQEIISSNKMYDCIKSWEHDLERFQKKEV